MKRILLVSLVAIIASLAVAKITYNTIPPVADVARMARYIVHKTDWCVLSHITHQRNATGYPMGRVFSMSDGPVGKSSGTPYIYTSFYDAVARDLKIDSKCAMSMSLVQTDYCKEQDLDPENPRCAQVMLIGNFEFIVNGSKEWDFAKEALFSRHPEMKNWPESHGFRFGKLNIENIQIVDYFGGSKYPTVPEYYNATPNTEITKQPYIKKDGKRKKYGAGNQFIKSEPKRYSHLHELLGHITNIVNNNLVQG